MKFKTPEELQEKIDEYFELFPQYTADGVLVRPATITGLALHLGTYRDLLCNYQERDEFYDTIKTAKQRIENFYEERLVFQNATGSIFALKNFDWKDKTETQYSGELSISKVERVIIDPANPDS